MLALGHSVRKSLYRGFSPNIRTQVRKPYPSPPSITISSFPPPPSMLSDDASRCETRLLCLTADNEVLIVGGEHIVGGGDATGEKGNKHPFHDACKAPFFCTFTYLLYTEMRLYLLIGLSQSPFLYLSVKQNKFLFPSRIPPPPSPRPLPPRPLPPLPPLPLPPPSGSRPHPHPNQGPSPVVRKPGGRGGGDGGPRAPPTPRPRGGGDGGGGPGAQRGGCISYLFVISLLCSRLLL